MTMEIQERASASEQRRAHYQVQRAVKAGILVKPSTCAWCGAGGRIHAHHPDYARPLMVVWICNRCHGTHTQRYDREWKMFQSLRESG